MRVCRVTTIWDRHILDMMISGIIHSARKDLKKGAVGVQGRYGLVIFGASESGCKAFVSNMLRHDVPEGILCLGADSDSRISQNNIVTGLVLVLPEVAFLNQGAFDFIANQIDWLRDSDGNNEGGQAANRARVIADSDTTERLYNTWYASFQEGFRGKVWIVEQKDAKLADAITTKHIEAVLDRPGYRAKRFGKVKNESIVFDDYFAQLGAMEICQVVEAALIANPNVRVTVTALAMRKMFEHMTWTVTVREEYPTLETGEAPETYIIGD